GQDKASPRGIHFASVRSSQRLHKIGSPTTWFDLPAMPEIGYTLSVKAIDPRTGNHHNDESRRHYRNLHTGEASPNHSEMTGTSGTFIATWLPATSTCRMASLSQPELGRHCAHIHREVPSKG